MAKACSRVVVCVRGGLKKDTLHEEASCSIDEEAVDAAAEVVSCVYVLCVCVNECMNGPLYTCQAI